MGLEQGGLVGLGVGTFDDVCGLCVFLLFWYKDSEDYFLTSSIGRGFKRDDEKQLIKHAKKYLYMSSDPSGLK